MNKFVVLAVFVILFSINAQSEQSSTKQFCSNINCDCSALAGEYWNEICLQQEQLIKEGCLNKQNQGFCGIHGENAKPIALDIANLAKAPSNRFDYQNAYSLLAKKFTFIKKEAEDIHDDVQLANYYRAKQRLTHLDQELDNLFSISLSIQDLNLKDKKSKSLWRDIAKSKTHTAEKLYGMSTKFVGMINLGKKTFNITDITYTSKRLAGYAFEQAAYAYGKSGDNKKAAKLWRRAAQTSKDLISKNNTLFKSDQEKRFVMAQAAARLHRASYHWLLSQNQEEAKDSYDESIELYASMNKDIEVLVVD